MSVGSLGPDVIGMKRTQIIVSAIIIVGVLLATAGVAGAARKSSVGSAELARQQLLVQINAFARRTVSARSSSRGN